MELKCSAIRKPHKWVLPFSGYLGWIYEIRRPLPYLYFCSLVFFPELGKCREEQGPTALLRGHHPGLAHGCVQLRAGYSRGDLYIAPLS